MNKNKFLALAWAASAMLGLASQDAAAQVQPNLPWVGTWAEAASLETFLQQPQGSTPLGPSPTLSFNQMTLRQFVFTSVGGTAARLHFSNQYGTTPITLADIHIAQASATAGDTIAGTDALVTFSGQTTVTLQPGQSIVSDGIAVTVPCRSYMAISVFFPTNTQPTNLTSHFFANQRMLDTSGDVSSMAQIAPPSNNEFPSSYFFLTSMDVQSPSLAGTLVALGSSITDGMNSTFGGNDRWENFLAQRFASAGINVGILDAGVPGSRFVSDSGPPFGESLLNRLNRDVLSQPSVRWMVVGEFDDVPAGFTALKAALQSIITQAHAQQIKVICSTVTPFSSPSGPGNSEDVRQQYNGFVRTAGNGCDGVLDLDLALHDPSKPYTYLAQYNSGDNLHPNDAGYQVIANAMPLSIFTQATALAPANPSSDCVNGLTAGQTLTTLVSCDGRFALSLLSNGVMTVTQNDATGSHVLWTSQTDDLGGVQAEMQPTGNFVLRDANGRPVWATNTDANPGANLLMQNDGNVVVYSNHVAVWNTGTCCH